MNLLPQKVSDVQIAFPANVADLMPSMSEIPEEFKLAHNRWCRWQSTWFYQGLNESQIPQPKEGIDLTEAIRHLQVIQGSFEPKHEHKQAAVAYLASLWFVEPPACL